MDSFRDERELPSIKVTKELLESLEQYILGQASNLLGKMGEQAARVGRFKVSITDGPGTVTMGSFDQFNPTKFSNTTKAIELSYTSASLIGLDITVMFDLDRRSSKMRVACGGAGAQEFVRGVVAGIRDCLAGHTTWNKWFHPVLEIQYALAFISLGITVLWLKGLVSPPAVFPHMGGLYFIGILYVWVCPWFKPYTTFDSPRSDSKDIWWKRIWGGIILICGITGLTTWFNFHFNYFLKKAAWFLNI